MNPSYPQAARNPFAALTSSVQNAGAVSGDSVLGERRKTRKSPGPLDKALLRSIAIAEDCHREVENPEFIEVLRERDWTTENQEALGTSLLRCTELKTRLSTARTGKRTRTEEENSARDLLLGALNPIVVAARTKYRKGSIERRDYGVGADLGNAASSTLLELADRAHRRLAGDGAASPSDHLAGLKPDEITNLRVLFNRYQDADWARAEATQTAAQIRSELEYEVTDILNPLRRKLQGSVELAWPHMARPNANVRKTFHLPPHRRMTD